MNRKYVLWCMCVDTLLHHPWTVVFIFHSKNYHWSDNKIKSALRIASWKSKKKHSSSLTYAITRFLCMFLLRQNAINRHPSPEFSTSSFWKLFAKNSQAVSQTLFALTRINGSGKVLSRPPELWTSYMYIWWSVSPLRQSRVLISTGFRERRPR